ncbi:hypothetical protein CEP52_002405 [Fusarium oligoseptatum]|uniref:Uncharacterized protein n=1 Tax=Fusarium oligoseptatum TaxID=2604345 RepID=A0A428UE85_9HYPO|nr:hypothetical protein CEP52_002405 [Fusarium oligoseptatum]
MERDGDRIRLPESPGAPKEKFDVICTPGRPRDATVRLNLGVFHDLDDELEEFNRYVRRGEFGTARVFFDKHLLAHVAYPWVFVQYAEMLFEMGDYKSLLQLNAEPVFRLTQFGNRHEDVEAMRRLEINWRLLKASALCHSQHELQPVLDEVCQPHEIIPVSANLGSTEVRIICLAMNLMSVTDRGNAGATALPSDLADWGNWSRLYQELQAQGRIWDFRDLFTTACVCFGITSAEEQFFGSRTIVESIWDDWPPLGDDDESSLLARLDIFATMALLSVNQVKVESLTETYLYLAGPQAEALITSFPHLVKSRPFLRFIIAQSSISLRRGKRSQLAYDYLADFPGLGVFPLGIDMPYYVPVGMENPGWEPPDLPESSFEPLEMALKAAKELKDYRTQALCVKELALRSREPSKYFEELGRLQTETQDDMEGYLTTCLARYLIKKDKESKAKLLRDLNDFGAWQEPSNMVSPSKACARDIIKRALSSSHPTYTAQSVEAGLRYYQWLPEPFQGFIDEHVERPRPRPSTPAPHLFEQPRPSVPKRQPSFERRSNDIPNYYMHDVASPRIRPRRERQSTPPLEEQSHVVESDLIDIEADPRRLSSSAPPRGNVTSRPIVEDEARSKEHEIIDPLD